MNYFSFKKKYVLFFSILILFMIGGSCVYALGQENEDSSVSFNAFTFGKLLGDNNRDQESKGQDSIYAKGKHINISEDEFNLMVKVYELEHSANPKEDALQDLLTKKVLYYNAAKNGYSTSDSEVDAIITELKASLKKADNSSYVLEFMKGFGSEDAYWLYTRDITKRDTTINKYLEDLKAVYAKKTHYTGEDSTAFQNSWNDYKADLTDKLIKKEKVRYKK